MSAGVRSVVLFFFRPFGVVYGNNIGSRSSSVVAEARSECCVMCR